MDHSRVADVGPDRAAAEWILRLGGSVKFESYKSWTTDYNRMPAEPKERFKLEGIDASSISITNNGLEHLGEDTHRSMMPDLVCQPCVSIVAKFV